jgi:hypothetical protein
MTCLLSEGSPLIVPLAPAHVIRIDPYDPFRQGANRQFSPPSQLTVAIG